MDEYDYEQDPDFLQERNDFFGNYADFWLGQPPGTNSFITDGPAGVNNTWRSAELFLKDMRDAEVASWTSERDLAESLIKHDTERGGGIQGSTPEMQHFRSQLLSRGRLALEWERRMGR